MAVKMTFFMNADKFGWSESKYFAGASSTAAVEAKALELAVKRANLLAKGATLDFCRLSVVGDFRNSDLVSEQTVEVAKLGLTNGSWLNAGVMAKHANVSLTLLCKGGGNKSSIEYMAGFPEGVNPGLSQINILAVDGFKVAWMRWRQAILDAGLSFRTKTSRPAVGAATAITGAVNDPVQNGMVVVSSPNLGVVTPGSKVTIFGSRMLNSYYKPLNGTWTVFNVAPGFAGGDQQITLAHSAGVSPANLAVRGFIYLNAPTYTPYASLEINGVTHRKRGVGSFAPRGRVRPQREYVG